MKRSCVIIVAGMLILNLLSLLALYSSLHQAGEFTQHELFERQVIWIIIAWAVFLAFAMINYRLYYDLSYLFYGMAIFFLLVVMIFGREIMGAKRWITILGIQFQPSEFSKVALVLLLARLFSRIEEAGNVFLYKMVMPFSLVALMALLIFKQPDLGTALICIFLFFVMGFSSRVNKFFLFLPIIAGLIIAPLGWHALKDYQKKRLLVFVNPNIDPWGAGYTIIQSKIAIGSGKYAGKGFLSGTQNQFNFLPERHTDFIFTVIAEEWGFLGSLFLLILYYLILSNILAIGRECGDEYGFFLCVGSASLFFLHIFVNMGMTMGILPVVGIPLLFMSYGGTHILISAMLLGIVCNIARQSRI